MAFNPAVTDRRGEITMQGAANQADLLLAGAQGMASGISQAGQGIAGGILDGYERYTKQKDDKDQVQGSTDFLKKMGVLTPEQVSELEKQPLGYQKALVGHEIEKWSVAQQVQRQNDYLKNQTASAASLAEYKSLVNPPASQVVPTATGLYAIDPRTNTGTPITDPSGQPLQPKPSGGGGLDWLLGGAAAGAASGAPAQAAPQTTAPQKQPQMPREGQVVTQIDKATGQPRRYRVSNGQMVEVR